MTFSRIVVGVAALMVAAAACGDADKPTKATDSVVSPSGDQFCDAMAQLIVLVTPSDGPTSPAETEATFADAAVQFQLALEAAPASIATDFAAYSAAFGKYIDFLSTVDYNLDAVFSTEEGTKLATDTSHTLTPAIVDYTINQCGLSFGEEEHKPPAT